MLVLWGFRVYLASFSLYSQSTPLHPLFISSIFCYQCTQNLQWIWVLTKLVLPIRWGSLKWEPRMHNPWILDDPIQMKWNDNQTKPAEDSQLHFNYRSQKNTSLPANADPSNFHFNAPQSSPSLSIRLRGWLPRDCVLEAAYMTSTQQQQKLGSKKCIADSM